MNVLELQFNYVENFNRSYKISMNGQWLKKHSCGNTRSIKTGKSHMMNRYRCMCISRSLKSYHTFRLDFTGHSGRDTKENY